MKATKIPITFPVLADQIYRQLRINRANGKSDVVDIIANKKYADLFHKMVENEAKANCAIPKDIEYKAEKFCGVKARLYIDCMRFPRCTVNVIIADNSLRVFCIPDYQALTRFCFLENKTFPLMSAL